LIPYRWLAAAEDRDTGSPGERWVAVDVARYGRDRTVFLVSEGGTLLYGKTIGRTPDASVSHSTTSREATRRPERAITATADVAQELRQRYRCVGVIVDDTGVGGGVTDILKQRGERVVPLHFGARPTDLPATPEARELRARRHQVDSMYFNLKAQLSWRLRGAFERDELGLARLPRPVLEALVAQASLVKYEYDTQEKLRVLDPDDDDDLSAAAGNLEGRRSPGHFRALLLLWAKAGNALRAMEPRAAAIPPRVARIIGEPIGTGSARGIVAGAAGGPTAYVGGVRVGGQAAWVTRYYRP
jgi:hypothetical protein